MLWKFNDIAIALNIQTTQKTGGVQDVCIDSRYKMYNALFIPLKNKKDGHDFIQQAWRNGAVATLCNHDQKEKIPDGMISFLVQDTNEAFFQLAVFARQRTTAVVIAITGSVGKTTTKDMFKTVLEDFVFVTHGNLNNHFGVPLTLICMPQNIPYAVIELGMNHAGEISKLTKLVCPHIVIITSIALVHLNNLNSLEEIAFVKSEIFDGLSDNGIAILPYDSVCFSFLFEKANQYTVYSFGENGGDARLLCFENGVVHVNVMNYIYSYSFPIIQKHMVMNSLSVLLTLHILQCASSKILKNFLKFTNTNGRGNIQIIGDWHVINDTYNASPIATHAALKDLLLYPPSKRKVAILGDMKELGEKSLILHLQLKDYLSGIYVFAVGLYMSLLAKTINPKFVIGSALSANDSQSLNKLKYFLHPGDIILIKGSRSMRMELIIDYLKKLQMDYY